MAWFYVQSAIRRFVVALAAFALLMPVVVLAEFPPITLAIPISHDIDDIAVDDADNIYVTANGTIYCYNSAGVLRWQKVLSTSVSANRLAIWGSVIYMSAVVRPDVRVFKLKTNGDIEWERNFGQNSESSVTDLEVDGSGNVFAGGRIGPASDLFAVISADGVMGRRQRGTQFYSSAPELTAISVDRDGGVAVAIGFQNEDWDIDLQSFGPGTSPRWSRRIIGSQFDYVYAAAVTSSGETYFGGTSLSPALNFGGGGLQLNWQGFLVKYGPQGNLLSARTALKNSTSEFASHVEDLAIGPDDSIVSLEGYALRLPGTGGFERQRYRLNLTRTTGRRGGVFEVAPENPDSHVAVWRVAWKGNRIYFAGGTQNVTHRLGTYSIRGSFLAVADDGPMKVPPTLLEQPGDLLIEEGQTLSLRVLAEGAMPISYQWYFGAGVITNETSAILTLPNITSTREGLYRVKVSNADGEVWSRVAKVDIIPVEPVMVTSVAGGEELGFANGPGTEARFRNPDGPVVNRLGVIYVADAHNHAIRYITPGGTVGTLAGDGVAGWREGPGAGAQFRFPIGLGLHPSGDLVVADFGNSVVERVVTFGLNWMTTVAGSGEVGALNSTNAFKATFNSPNDVAVDVDGTIYVSEFQNHMIRRIGVDGEVRTLAGKTTAGYADGIGSGASFNQPSGITLAPDGNLYVTEWGNHRVRQVTKAGVVTTICGTNVAGLKDGLRSEAWLNIPNGITADHVGNLYITENGNHAIRKIYPNGYVQLVAGTGHPGFANGAGRSAQFNAPGGIALHVDGSLVVADTLNHRIRRVQVGEPVVEPAEPFVQIETNPALLIHGTVGKKYRVESLNSLGLGRWVGLENVTLTNAIQHWTDPRPMQGDRRVYRVEELSE